MKTETEAKRAELYVSECCIFEAIITKNRTRTRCLTNISRHKFGRFRRILQRLFTHQSICRCECHHN